MHTLNVCLHIGSLDCNKFSKTFPLLLLSLFKNNLFIQMFWKISNLEIYKQVVRVYAYTAHGNDIQRHWHSTFMHLMFLLERFDQMWMYVLQTAQNFCRQKMSISYICQPFSYQRRKTHFCNRILIKTKNCSSICLAHSHEKSNSEYRKNRMEWAGNRENSRKTHTHTRDNDVRFKCLLEIGCNKR